MLDHYIWGEGGGGEGRGGSCIYLPECLAFVLTHNSSLMHPLFAMLAFLHCRCLAKYFAAHIINIFVSVAMISFLSLQIFTGSLLNSDGREKYEVNTETNMNFSLEEIRTFHWKKYELFTGRNMNFSTEEI